MITELTATIEESAAKESQCTTDVANLKSEIAKETAALEQATALRAKESAEFNTDEKDAIASITSLKGAVTTLSKHHEGSALLQRQALMQVTTMLRRQLKSQPRLLSGVVAHQRQ